MSREDEPRIELATDLTALEPATQPNHSTVFRKKRRNFRILESLDLSLPARSRRLLINARKAYEGKVI